MRPETLTSIRPERAAAWALLAVTLALNAAALLPELSITRLDLNDNVLHLTIVERMVQAIERGENPLDCWLSELSLGSPLTRVYQPLGHLAVALLYYAVGKTVSLVALFVWVRFLLLVLLPASAFASARLLGLGPRVAAAAALVSPLISTGALYGIEYGSFVWRGSGLYSQLCAVHLLLWSLGLAYRAVRNGRLLAPAGVALGLTFLAHFIYGWMAAVSVVLLAMLPDRSPRSRRLVRAGIVGLVAAVLTAFQTLSLLRDGPWLNHSRWEGAWKWDSFGEEAVLSKLVRGDLLDFGRFPSLSLLALVGAVSVILSLRPVRARWKRLASTLAWPEDGSPAATFILAGCALWLALFFGRETWGILFGLLGAPADTHLHRLIGGSHLFSILLAAIGLERLWTAVARIDRPWRIAAATMVTLPFLLAAARERSGFLRQNGLWGEQSAAVFAESGDDLEEVLSLVADRNGRLYAGLAAGWGARFAVGSVPVYAFASTRHLPAVSFLYHSMALTSDLMVHFDEKDEDHYRLFAVRSVVADESQQLPDFLTTVHTAGRFRLLAPRTSHGYFDLVSVPMAARCDRRTHYDVNHAWLTSDWVGKRQHLRLLCDRSSGNGLALLEPVAAPLPSVEAATGLGAIVAESRDGEVYRATVLVDRDANLLFKMTYHPNWKATIDGEVRPTVMLSPGFLGVEIGRGRHDVELRYVPERWRLALMLSALPFAALFLMLDRRGALRRLEERSHRLAERAAHAARLVATRPAVGRWTPRLGVVALALPVCLPLLSDRLLAGHDAFVYFPRVVEFHENIRQGILLPRWAPDLSAGLGQPFFLFNPPLLYYVGEIFHLLGLGPVAAVNLSLVVLVAAGAWFMYLLGNLVAGRAGGLLGAAAYLYAPYFLVNLFVRHASAESAALTFFPLAIYGVVRFARDRRTSSLALSSLGLAGVLFSHHPASLLFTPVMVAIVAAQAWRLRSWRLLVAQAFGVLIGLALAAAVWLPSLTEMRFTSVDRLLKGPLDYVNHFVYPQQVIVTRWGYGLSVPGYGDDMSFSLGWPQLLLLALVWRWRRREPQAAGSVEPAVVASIAAAAVLLMMPGSVWLWDHLPLLHYIQFPWRWLGPAAFCLALLIAMLAVPSFRLPNGTRWRRVAAALALLVLPNLGHARPARRVDVTLDDWTPDQIARRAISINTRREYEPRWASGDPRFEEWRVKVVEGRATTAQPAAWDLESRSLEVKAETEALLEVRLHYFPGWTARLDDGQELELRPSELDGLMRLRVPAGTHRVDLEFERTWPRWLGEGVSLVGLLALVGLWVRDSRGRSARVSAAAGGAGNPLESG